MNRMHVVLPLALIAALQACSGGPQRRFTFSNECAVTLQADSDRTVSAEEAEAVEAAWRGLTEAMATDPGTREFLRQKLVGSGGLDVVYSHDIGGIEARENGLTVAFADVAGEGGSDAVACVRSEDGRRLACRRTVAVGWVGGGIAEAMGDADPGDVFDAAATRYLKQRLPRWVVVDDRSGR